MAMIPSGTSPQPGMPPRQPAYPGAPVNQQKLQSPLSFPAQGQGGAGGNGVQAKQASPGPQAPKAPQAPQVPQTFLQQQQQGVPRPAPSYTFGGSMGTGLGGMSGTNPYLGGPKTGSGAPQPPQMPGVGTQMPQQPYNPYSAQPQPGMPGQGQAQPQQQSQQQSQGGQQQQAPGTAQANQMGGALQSLLTGQLQNPNPYNSSNIQTMMQTLNTPIQEQQQQQLAANESNMASRGLANSNINTGFINDINTQAGRQQMNSADMLLQNAAQAQMQGTNSAVSNALGYGNQQFGQSLATAQQNQSMDQQQQQYMMQLLGLS